MKTSAWLAIALFVGACGGSGGKKETMPTDEQDKVGTDATLTEEGATRETAVAVCMPAGERAWIEARRCADGTAPVYARVGSVGAGPDGHILDLYEVKCPEKSWEVFMDMYHCEDEDPQ